MKNRVRIYDPLTALRCGLMSGLLVLASPTLAATTDLADIPLANATATIVLPNIAFVLDDSGSMNDENMPDDDATNKTKYCWKWRGYNTLAYNPAVTYKPPIKADGTRFPDASFTAAKKDGYFAVTAKMYDGGTNNGTTDLSAISNTGDTEAEAVFPNFSRDHRVTSVKVTLLDSTVIELLNTTPVPAAGTDNEDAVGNAVAASINAKTGITGFSATYSNFSNTLTITAPPSQAGLTTKPSITTQKTEAGGSLQTVTTYFFNTIYTGYYYTTHKTNPSSTTCEANANYSVTSNASDITAPNVTTGSAEAKTNYANWYSYYRKRAFVAKASAGEAFAALEEDKYRVGLFFIESIESESDQTETNHDLKIAKFSGTATGTQRGDWFDRLYGTRQAFYTPLRGALSRMGRMYSGKISGWDPVQHSCQRNFTILTTDGYWNTNAETTSAPRYGPYREDNATLVDKQDGSPATRPELDSLNVADTLADVAYYYWHNDLRTPAKGNCTGVQAENGTYYNVCTNNVPSVGTDSKLDDFSDQRHQRMTTFTIGLGVDGTLQYQEGYKTSTSGDFYDIKQGTKNWPSPIAGDLQKIDDLWHAAVNGRGTYFSAKTPESFTSGLRSALGSIQATNGSGAAAATSNLQPTNGDNYIYIANYTTITWTGELSAYTIALDTGAISSSPVWQASPKLDARICASLGASPCGAGKGDTRKIYTVGGSGGLVDFEWANLSSVQQAYFDETKLSQYAGWATDQQTASTGPTMVQYLRGYARNENQDRPSDFGTYYRLYRDREKTLGDIVHSQPLFVKGSFYNFADAGYSTFKTTTTAGRAGTVYVAANDGMLHALSETDGEERWAFVPPLIMEEMWRLASEDYASNHRFFVDGPIAVSDANAGGWKTILVGALGKGGRGYYALDITNPDSPQYLWSFTANDNPNVGYTYGTPMITKLDGNWVVLVTSGYNNIPEGPDYSGADGKGYVWALNAATGAVVKTWETGVGDITAPSGLARINIKVADFETDNSMMEAYGGDLYGNMWRFNNDGTVNKIIDLGTTQSIMAPPEIGEIDGNTVLFFGTGRYLGEDDLDDHETQALYAVKAKVSGSSSKGNLVEQIISGTTVTTSNVDWSLNDGWFVNLGDTERVNLPAQLYFGTILFASTIPPNTATADCEPGGSSRLFMLDFRTGGAIDNNPAITSYSSPIVGFTVAKLPGGTPKVYPITADGGFPTSAPPNLLISSDGGGGVGSGRRVMWRELVN